MYLTGTSKKKPKESQFTLATSKTKKGAEVVKSNLALSREKARAGKIVVESTSIEKSKPKRHFVAQMDFSSDSSSSSSSSDSEPSFSTPSRYTFFPIKTRMYFQFGLMYPKNRTV